MQLAEFTLKNLFIIHPNKSSEYKLRITINHQTSESAIKNEKQKYKLQFSINNTVLQMPYGFICLLQNDKKSETSQFLQIGKGELDFAEVLGSLQNNQSTLNGIIYGTRAANFDRIIAKYGYEILKSKLQPQNGKLSPQIIFKNHKRKQKLPFLSYKKALLDPKNSSINNKIKLITDSILEQNQDLQKTKNNQTQISQDQPKPSLKIQQFPYYYKISQKLEQNLLKSTPESRWIKIKTIKVFKFQSPSKPPPHQHYDKDIVLLKVHQNTSIKIFELVIKLIYNSNNHFQDLIFPIPQSSSPFHIDISFLQNSSQLRATFDAGTNITKTVDLHNEQGEEIGFISIQIFKNNRKDINFNNYQHQLKDFMHFYRKFPVVLRKQIGLEGRKSREVGKIYSMNTSKQQSPTVMGLSRTKTRSSYMSQIKNQGTSQSNEVTLKTPKQKTNNLNLYNKIKSSLSRDSKVSPSSPSLCLKIKNVYLHLYQQGNHKPILLKLIVAGATSVKQIYNGYNNLELISPIILDCLEEDSQILLTLLPSMDKPQDIIAGCSINVGDLIKSTVNQLKIFVRKKNQIGGYIILEVTLYRIKQDRMRFRKRYNTSLLNHQQYEIQIDQDRQNQQRAYQSKPKPSNHHFYDWINL